MIEIVAGLVGSLVIIYLLITVIKPEKF